jgi:hypothetical protein
VYAVPPQFAGGFELFPGPFTVPGGFNPFAGPCPAQVPQQAQIPAVQMNPFAGMTQDQLRAMKDFVESQLDDELI